MGLAQAFKKEGLTPEHIEALKATNPAEYQKFKISAGKLATQLGASKQKIYSTSDDTIDRVINLLRGPNK